ncbi:MAG: LuxR C-terminal-related transcriptional regulator [Chloroflexota bacterium]
MNNNQSIYTHDGENLPVAADHDTNQAIPITRREREILQLLSEGLLDREIAARLFLSVGTVKWHVKNIYAKLGVERRTQAVKRAREFGLLNTAIAAVQAHEDRLPSDTTSFVDRRVATEHILQTLDNPACRLLTLIGSGGIGKTRLAIHAARNTSTLFREGKVFISLVGVSLASVLAPTIANALSFSFYGPEEPETQLVRYLSNKTALLIIDNYESLLPDVALLAQILEQAPNIKLLITSRERLNVREEWLFPVDGLPVRTLETQLLASEHDAFDLFVQRASQVNPDFRGIGQDMPFVLEICRQVEGIPLALELAAGWVRSLTPKEIAEEMSKSFKLLTTGLHNIPERHRSMRIVFEQTWARLSTQERTVMEALSVFRGGFTREAAEQVAGADLELLAMLQDKSLIERQVSGRYAMHELLCQFADSKLALTPTGHIDVQNRHCQYFAQLMWEKRMAFVYSGHYQSVATFQIDIENIRRAWHWMVSQEDWATFERSWETVNLLCHVTAQFHMGITLFAYVLEHVRPVSEDQVQQRAMIIALNQTAWHSFMTNQITTGLKLVEEALALIDSANIDDPRLLFYAFHTHTCLLWAQGDYEMALQQCRRLQEVANQTDILLYQENVHFDFGIIYLGLGEFEQSRAHFENLVAHGTQIQYAYASIFLGQIAEALGKLPEAQALYAKSLDLYRLLDHRWGIVMALINLGRATGRGDELWDAAACLYEALDLALDIQTPQQIMGSVVEITFLFPAVLQTRLAIALLEFIQTQSPAWQEYSERIVPYLVELRLLEQANPTVAEQIQASLATMDQVIETVQAARSQFQKPQT